MKFITYEIRGHISADMMPAIIASCESLEGVLSAEIRVKDDDHAALLLKQNDPSDPTQLDNIRAILTAKDLEILSVSDSDAHAPAVSQTPKSSSDGQARHYVAAPPPKPRRTVGLASAIGTTVTAVVLAVLLTFSLTTIYQKADIPPTADVGQGEEAKNPVAALEAIDRLFRSATMLELDDETIITSVLKAYVAATGDRYAEYFTAEEFEAQVGSQNGEMCGIGVSVVNSTLTSEGITYQTIVVANVYADSPAEKAGVLPGDCIMYVGTGDDRKLVHDIGYTTALDLMAGEEGTACTFTVWRPTQGVEPVTYTPVEITATRQKLTTLSVIAKVYEPDPTVGVVRLLGFDNTTRDQFNAAIDTLRASGCTRFVLDLRSNPGGLLSSVEDVLVYFLREGDTIISTKDAAGNEAVTTLTVNQDGIVTCGSGTLTKADIGKYAELDYTVLVNGYSASAAELFTANIRDHGLATIVGDTTYGKGSMQTTYSLSRYGFDGALKLTTAYYYPPSGKGYDGIGITPDVPVSLSEEAKLYNLNLLPHALDNQLAAAVEAIQ